MFHRFFVINNPNKTYVFVGRVPAELSHYGTDEAVRDGRQFGPGLAGKAAARRGERYGSMTWPTEEAAVQAAQWAGYVRDPDGGFSRGTTERAWLVIQCSAPDGRVGNFLSRYAIGNGCFQPVTAIFTDSVECYKSLAADGWRELPRDPNHPCGVYERTI